MSTFQSFILFLFLFSSYVGQTQILNNQHGEVWTDEPFFNAQFIRKNNIKSIKGRYSYKNAGSPMYETPYRHVFEFDTLGRVSTIYETRADDGTSDTIYQHYAYNSKGLLIYFSRGTSSVYYYETYQYNEDCHLIFSEQYNQVKYESGEVSTILKKKESYEYVQDGADTVKLTRNSYDLAYKKEWKTYNRLGLVTRIDERFLSNGQGKTELFEFNNDGLLGKKSFQTTRQAYPKNVLTFTYDLKGNVQEKKIWYDDELKKEIQFIYNDESGKISAILEREDDGESISIIRFQDYVYFNEVEFQ